MAKGKAALGRGLGALLPDATDDAQQQAPPSIADTRLYDFNERVRAGNITQVELARVTANPYQPRESFDEEALRELAQSIEQLGIIQPITVRAKGNGDYELISGERRVRASRLAGLTMIPAYIREANTEAMLEMAIVENVQREELNPIEVALGYLRLVEECDLTQEEVATKVGKSRAAIANFLRLLKLPVSIQASLRDGTISVGHARALIPLEDLEVQEKLVDEIAKRGLSVRAVEDLVKKWLGGDRSTAVKKPLVEAPPRDEIMLRALTDRLRSGLGTKVAIKPSNAGDGGRIEIDYYSNDDLERLIEILGD